MSSMPSNHSVPADFGDRLLRWHRTAGRHDLPWQREATPYRVWVSEIMLQQTQVATVIPYFEHFVQVFPDVRHVAVAEPDAVLRHRTGLLLPGPQPAPRRRPGRQPPWREPSRYAG